MSGFFIIYSILCVEVLRVAVWGKVSSGFNCSEDVSVEVNKIKFSTKSKEQH